MDAPQPTTHDSMPTADQQNPKKRSTLKTVLYVVAGIIAFIAIVGGLAIFLTSGAAQAGEKFLNNLSTGKVEQAYNESSDLFKNYDTLENFKTFLKDYPILTQKNSVFFNSRSVKNDQAELYGTVKSADGKEMPIHMWLQNEKDVWRVTGMDFNPKKEETTDDF